MSEDPKSPPVSSIKTWEIENLPELSSPELSSKDQERWKHVAEEVRLRKGLLLAARDDLSNNGVENCLKLAAADVFVEVSVHRAG